MDVDKYLFEPAFFYNNPLYYNKLTCYPHIIIFYPHFEKNSYFIWSTYFPSLIGRGKGRVNQVLIISPSPYSSPPRSCPERSRRGRGNSTISSLTMHSKTRLNIFFRILRYVIFSYFVMQMRSRSSGPSGKTNYLTSFYPVTFFNEDL